MFVFLSVSQRQISQNCDVMEQVGNRIQRKKKSTGNITSFVLVFEKELFFVLL